MENNEAVASSDSTPEGGGANKLYEESSRIIFINPEEWVVEQFLTVLVRAV